MRDILNILSNNIYSEICKIESLEDIQEIRLNINKPIIILSNNKEIILNYKVLDSDIKSIMQKISNYSLYAFEEEIRQGYITIEGGHRVGLSGQCVMERDRIKTIKNISKTNWNDPFSKWKHTSKNIRIFRFLHIMHIRSC